MARPARPAAPTSGERVRASSGSDTPAADPVDALYQQPLGAFTVARNELAKSLTRAGARDQAARVKALAKPAVVPWAVNQVYLRAPSVWHRLIAAGDAVRAAQIAAIERPAGDPSAARRGAVQDVAAAHRQAVADAVHQALRAAASAGLQPPSDAVARMLEALSLTTTLPGAAGRLTEVVQPAGLEALAGVTPAPSPRTVTAAPDGRHSSGRPGASDTAAGRGSRSTRTDDAAVVRAREARIAAATAALAQAWETERQAQDDEAAAARALDDLELRVTQARAALARSRAAARSATDGRQRAEAALARARSGG